MERERNARRFENRSRPKEKILEVIKFEVGTKIQNMTSRQENPVHKHVHINWGVEMDVIPLQVKTCIWLIPGLGWWSLSSDGSLSNSRASYGGILRNEKGEALFTFSGMIDMIRCLGLSCLEFMVIQNGCRKLQIIMDPKVVDIISSKCRIPWKMMFLSRKINLLLAQCEEYEIQHVWREVNQSADILASLVNDLGKIILYPMDFPVIPKEAIMRDASDCVYSRL